MHNDDGPCFYCPDLPANGELAALGENETHHASASRRIRVGDAISLIDGSGTRAAAVVETVSRKKLTLKVLERRLARAPDPSVHVSCAVPKGERFRVLVDMLSQIGVSGITPLLCERSAVKPRPSSVDRWRRVAIEGCKQSRNPYLPAIDEPMSLEAALQRVPVHGTVAFADINGTGPETVVPGAGLLHLYIGPEGGFTEAEENLMRNRGASPLCLGRNILRIETAVVVGATLVLMGGGAAK